MKTLLLTIAFTGLSFGLFAGAPVSKGSDLVVNKVYKIDGQYFKFLGIDQDGQRMFEGHSFKLPKYHTNKRLQRINRKRLNNTKR